MFCAYVCEDSDKVCMMLGEMPCRCYKLLKEGLGSHTVSYGTAQWWVYTINARQEDTAEALCRDVDNSSYSEHVECSFCMHVCSVEMHT